MSPLSVRIKGYVRDPAGAGCRALRLFGLGEMLPRRFVYKIAPHKDRTLHHDRPVTSINELVKRNRKSKPDEAEIDRLWSVRKTEDFVELVEFLELPIHPIQDTDDKIRNGFTVVSGDFAECNRDAWMDHVKTKLFKCA